MISMLSLIVYLVALDTSTAEMRLQVKKDSYQNDDEVLDDGTCLLQTSVLCQRQGISKHRSSATASIQNKVHTNATSNTTADRGRKLAKSGKTSPTMNLIDIIM